MVMHRIQADILCQDKDRAQALYDQLVSQAPNYAAVGREDKLFEPSSVSIQVSAEDDAHLTELRIDDPAIAAEVWAFLASKHPELLPKSEVAPSYIQLHDCYHDEAEPQPCVIASRYEVTPQDAVEKGIPVVGSVVGGEVKVITAEFEAQVLSAKAVREAAVLEAVELPVKGVVTKEAVR